MSITQIIKEETEYLIEKKKRKKRKRQQTMNLPIGTAFSFNGFQGMYEEQDEPNLGDRYHIGMDNEFFYHSK